MTSETAIFTVASGGRIRRAAASAPLRALAPRAPAGRGGRYRVRVTPAGIVELLGPDGHVAGVFANEHLARTTGDFLGGCAA